MNLDKLFEWIIIFVIGLSVTGNLATSSFIGFTAPKPTLSMNHERQHGEIHPFLETIRANRSRAKVALFIQLRATLVHLIDPNHYHPNTLGHLGLWHSCGDHHR